VTLPFDEVEPDDHSSLRPVANDLERTLRFAEVVWRQTTYFGNHAKTVGQSNDPMDTRELTVVREHVQHCSTTRSRHHPRTEFGIDDSLGANLLRNCRSPFGVDEGAGIDRYCRPEPIRLGKIDLEPDERRLPRLQSEVIRTYGNDR
jgi:hypothetical protein